MASLNARSKCAFKAAPAGITPLMLACMRELTDTALQLLSFPGITINTQDESGWTAAHYACYVGLDSVCERLAQMNADFSILSSRPFRFVRAHVRPMDVAVVRDNSGCLYTLCVSRTYVQLTEIERALSFSQPELRHHFVHLIRAAFCKQALLEVSKLFNDIANLIMKFIDGDSQDLPEEEVIDLS